MHVFCVHHTGQALHACLTSASRTFLLLLAPQYCSLSCSACFLAASSSTAMRSISALRSLFIFSITLRCAVSCFARLLPTAGGAAAPAASLSCLMVSLKWIICSRLPFQSLPSSNTFCSGMSSPTSRISAFASFLFSPSSKNTCSKTADDVQEPCPPAVCHAATNYDISTPFRPLAVNLEQNVSCWGDCADISGAAVELLP